MTWLGAGELAVSGTAGALGGGRMAKYGAIIGGATSLIGTLMYYSADAMISVQNGDLPLAKSAGTTQARRSGK